MEQHPFSNSSFIDPSGKNIDDVKSFIEEVINSVLDHASSSSLHSPLPELKKMDFSHFPDKGLPSEEILTELKDILSNSMNALTPNYIGHMDSIPTLISCLCEFVTTALNNNMLSYEMSPVFSQMEVQVLSKISKMFGYGETGGGVMASGGSLANLQALAVARNHKLKVKETGLTSMREEPVILVSEVSHTSLQKAAMLLGLGTNSIISVKSNDDSQMDILDLEFKINDAVKQGKKPFAIVATAGTTVTGSIDPLHAISTIAKRYGLWLHVDAAYGGALIFSKKYFQKLAGIENADSITFNPQKWLYVAKTCAMVLFKNSHHLETDFQISAPYMNDTEFTNLGEISVQGTRHADILKLYFSIKQIGLNGYEELINDSYTKTEELLNQLKNRHFLELASEVDTNICCFRLKDTNLNDQQSDELNYELQQFLLRHESFFISLPLYRGKRWLRVVLLNPYTSKQLIHQLLNAIDNFYSSRLLRKKESSELGIK